MREQLNEWFSRCAVIKSRAIECEIPSAFIGQAERYAWAKEHLSIRSHVTDTSREYLYRDNVLAGTFVTELDGFTMRFCYQPAR